MMFTRTILVLSLATFALAVPVGQIGEPPSPSPGSVTTGWVFSAVASVADGMVYLVILEFVLLTSKSWSSNRERTSIWSRLITTLGGSYLVLHTIVFWCVTQTRMVLPQR
ncbi:hypothetical protein EDB83DRAFT_2404382 [Lactarius deliciosus]|nr:hypothetical protein EDB83DRAFT_2404382 [Lactarius deliciosus]